VKLHRNARTTPISRSILVRRILADGWRVDQAAAAAGISRQTARKWVLRYRAHGLPGLEDRSSAPHSVPHRTPARVVARIEQLRRKRLTGLRIAWKLRMAVSTVSAVLRRLGLGRLWSLDPKPEIVRYERERPGELLHLDVKKLGRIGRVGKRITGDKSKRCRGIGWEFAHICIDDMSRVAYVEILPDERKETAAGFLRRAVSWFEASHVRVKRVMTDNGSCYVSKLFGETCAELGQRHVRTRPYRPQTNGKAERSIKTLINEWAYATPYPSSDARARALGPWLSIYNLERPHAALGYRASVTRLPGEGEQPT
jgi:transposase InsO family protein